MSDRAVQFCRRAGPIALLAVALSSEIFHASPVWAQERQSVELELVLAVDTSLSVNADEFAVQMDGLALAFRNRAVIAAIEAAGDNGIAVALVQWGIGQQQEITVGWTHVHDRTSAERFSRAIEASPRRFYGKGTGITHALQFASRLFEDNGSSIFRAMAATIRAGPRPWCETSWWRRASSSTDWPSWTATLCSAPTTPSR
jgi:threonine dehydrogenase-like Zn-dependent dehydrogenase